MKIKRQTVPIQKLNLPLNDLTQMTKEEICEEFELSEIYDFQE